MNKKLSAKTGILLDLGCGGNKQGPQWVGMDKRKLPGVDIVHDIEKLPYPFEDESVLTCITSHVLEHMKPWLMLDIFNEVWRIMQVGGQWIIGVPYGVSHGFVQDPTHVKPFNESTFYYFDPYPKDLGWYDGATGSFNILYDIYKPKPWKILTSYWSMNGNMDVVLEKRSLP